MDTKYLTSNTRLVLEKEREIMNDEKRMEEIRADWFLKHKATYEKLSEDTSVLTWKKEGTSVYYVRYIFDRNRLFITGDIGDAVFVLTEKADFKTIATDYSSHYLFGKLRADNEAYDFNSELAIKSFKEHFNKEDIEPEDEADYNDLLEEVIGSIKDECGTTGQWEYCLSAGLYDRISEYDCDCWEWVSDIGVELSWQALGWVVGLQMAYDQLKESL